MEPLALTIGILFGGLLLRVCRQTWTDGQCRPPPQHHQEEETVYSTRLLCDSLPCRDMPCHHQASRSDVEDPEEEPELEATESPGAAESGRGAHPECCICLEPMVHSRRTPLKMMPCGHLYHQRCIRDWLRTENQIPCPHCGYDRIDYSRRITQ